MPTYFAALDLYYLFVEVIAGNFLLAVALLAGGFVIIGMLSKMSFTTIMFGVGMFILTISIAWAGTALAIFFLIAAVLYATYGISKVVLARQD